MSQVPFGLAVRAVVLDDEGRMLLVRRSKANRSEVGHWEWPGGKCNPGEPFDRALVREVQEETGLDVAPTGLAGAYEFGLPAVHVIVVCLRARVTGGRLALSSEHDEFAWVLPADVARRELVANACTLMLEVCAGKKGER